MVVTLKQSRNVTFCLYERSCFRDGLRHFSNIFHCLTYISVDVKVLARISLNVDISNPFLLKEMVKVDLILRSHQVPKDRDKDFEVLGEFLMVQQEL